MVKKTQKHYKCITVQQTVNIKQATFKSFVSFLRHTAELVRENKLGALFTLIPVMYCMQCGDKQWKHPEKDFSWK